MTINNINFQYDASKFTIIEQKTGYQQSLESCKNNFGKLLDLTTVNIDEFAKVFNIFAQKSKSSMFRIMSFNNGISENRCFGLVKNKLKRKKLSQIVYNVCSGDQSFDKMYASVCQAHANETEVLSTTTNSSLSTFKSSKNNTNVIAGVVIVAFALIGIAIFSYILKKRCTTAAENVRKQVGNLKIISFKTK